MVAKPLTRLPVERGGFFMTNTPEQLLEVIKSSLRLCIPWKQNIDDDYHKGWNDCVKQMREYRKEHLNNLEKILKASKGEK